jgi:SAM-dependent methyltransferase
MPPCSRRRARDLEPHVPLVSWNLDRDPPSSITAAALFALITCTNTFHYVRAPSQTVRVLGHLLAPGRQFIVADFIRHGWWWPAFEVLLHVVDRAHRATLSQQTLTQVIRASGLAIQSVHSVVVDPHWHGVIVVGQRTQDAHFDTVVATLALCSVPDERQVVAEAWRVLRPGGVFLLLEHVRSPHWPVRMVEHLMNPLAVRFQGDHLVREPLDALRAAGFTVEQLHRSKWGIVERVAARKAEV